MTIKELENRTGMTRANIRFYESEGLLAPKRLDNGYRDYSEGDVQTLEKIKLLRQLQLDLDTIRALQAGTLTMEQALFTQMTRLEGDRAMIEQAVQVCRELEASGVEYGALDPEPYLHRLEALHVPSQALPESAPAPAPEKERNREPQACYHPWQRLFARLLDMRLYGAVFDLLWMLLLRDQRIPMASGVLGWVLELLLLVFTLAVEPFWLHNWGWTLGKWVFGLKIRDVNGEKLTLAQGFQRSYVLAWEGYGLNIPLWGMWKMWKCRVMGLEGRDCCWDGEECYRYTKEERRFSGWIFAGAQVVQILVFALGVKYTQTPVNQGALTVRDFAENYNYYSDQLLDQSSIGRPSLSDDGRWAEQRNSDNSFVINLFGGTTRWDEPVFTLSGDRVLAVELHMESEDSLVGSVTRETLALLAMTGALDGLNLFNYDLKGWVDAYQEQASAWTNVDFTYRGLRIAQRVEYEGYSNLGTDLMQVDDDAPCHCEKTLTISLAEP